MRICLFTGSRADYGLLYPLAVELRHDPAIDLQILVTGMHLSPEFGLTFREIEKDGFVISEKVEILLSSDSPEGISKAIGLGVIGFAGALARLRPDFLIILGDRFEALAAAIAAMTARIPIAHLHGGEATQGLIDEPIRHSITKMSHLHFVATESYRRRVIQLGENPATVFNVGAIGLENLRRIPLLGRAALEESLDFRFGDKTALVTFHPVTLENASAPAQFSQLLQALRRFEALHVLFTKTNADTEGREINRLIDEFVREHPRTAAAFSSLGQQRYLSALKQVDVVVGNSSSGILEAPSLGTPTVNIGDRQKGRIKAASVLDCEPETEAIASTLANALTKKLKNIAATVDNPYQGQDTARRIKEILQTAGPVNLKKDFFDLCLDIPRAVDEKRKEDHHSSAGDDQGGD